MDEPQQQITDTSMADTSPDSAESAISPIRAPRPPTMVESEEEDSRTAVAGRKRGFQEAAHHEDAMEIAMSDDEEPSRKRAKENDPSSFVRAEDTLVTNITSVSPVPASAEEEAVVSRLPPVQSSSDSEQSRAADAYAQSGPSTASLPNAWNSGIQSGLRTSFGKATNTSNEGQPFRKLTNREVKSLSKEEQSAYKKDLFAWLGQTTAEKKANKKALLAPTSDFETAGNDAEEHTLQVIDPVHEQAMDDVNMEETMAQPLRPSTPAFKQLSDEEIGRLSATDRTRYWDAYFDHQKAHSVTPKAQVQSLSTGESSASGTNTIRPVEASSAYVPGFADASAGDGSDGSDSENDQDGSDEDEDEDEDEDYISRDTDKIQAQDSQIPSAADAQLLSAFGPPPTPPVPFQFLSKGQKKKLGKAEGKKYRADSAAYNDALNRYRNAKREYDAKIGNPQLPPSLPTNFEKKPTRLTKRQVSELTKADQEKYTKIMGAELLARKRSRMDKYHEEAETVLQQAKQWPLPPLISQSNPSVWANIRKGKTWYASHRTEKKNKGVRPYKCQKGTFKVAEVFDGDGLPLPIQQFSFNRFVPAFLKHNEADWNKMDQSVLKGAFNSYLSIFYVHATEFEPWVKQTAYAQDAISFKDAMLQVGNTLGMSRSSSANHAPAPSQTNRVASGPVKQEVVPQASAIVTGGRPKEDLPRTKEKDVVNRLEDDPDTVMTTAAPSIQAVVNTPTPTFAAVEDPDLRETLMFLQQKYYPSASSVIRCLSCAKTGHMSDTCPALNCMTCGARGKHSTLMCPRDMPCEKCRGHGHSRQQCPEKLSLPASEMTCDLCGSRNHLETACHNIWRSFDPSPNEIMTVSGIPVYCYTCGNSGHYGPDCGLFQGQKILSGGYTFSEANLLKYSDPSSRDRAISAGKDYSIPPRPSNKNNYSIKGKGRANDPITFDESEEEEQFLRPSIMPGNVPRGPIRFGNGQPPQASFRSGPSGPGDMNVVMRGLGPQGGGGGKKKQGERPKRAKPAPNRAPGRRAANRAAAANSGKLPARR